MAQELSGYRDAVSELHAASRGHWAGPSVPEEDLAERYRSLDGLDTGELREGAREAVGGSDPTPVRGWITQILKLVGTLGSGMLANELYNKAQEWFHNRDEVEEVGAAADRAADAVDETAVNADEGTAQILGQLVQVISEISVQLAQIDPQDHPEAFLACVEAGAVLIDQAAAMIGGLCADRDTAVAQCYGSLLEHGTAVCSEPEPELCDAAQQSEGGGAATGASGQSAGNGAGGGGGAGGAGGGGGAPAAGAGTTPTTVPPTSPATVNQGEEPEQQPTPETSAAPEKPAPQNPSGKPVPPESPERTIPAGTDPEIPAEHPDESPDDRPGEQPAQGDDPVMDEEADDCEPSSRSDTEQDAEQDTEQGADRDSDEDAAGEPDPESEQADEQPSGTGPEQTPARDPATKDGGGDSPDDPPENPAGSLGSQLLLMGVGILVAFLEQAVGEFPVAAAAVPEPPVVESAPPAPADPVPAGPPPELASVPEPPPKPIPAEVAAVDATTAPPPTPASVPEPAPAPAPPPPPAPEPAPASGARIHKAGGW